MKELYYGVVTTSKEELPKVDIKLLKEKNGFYREYIKGRDDLNELFILSELSVLSIKSQEMLNKLNKILIFFTALITLTSFSLLCDDFSFF